MLFTSVFAITERRDIGLYQVHLSMSLLGFGMGTMLANFHMWYVVIRAVFNMLVRNATPRGPMCFSTLFIASWTSFVVSVMLYPCILCVALLMDLFV